MQAVHSGFTAHRQALNGADGLRRTMTISIGVHVSIVLILFLLPRDWLAREKPEPIAMSLTFGSPGEKTSGLTPAGAQPIEEVAPAPKRPTPLPVVTPPKTEAIAVPTKPPTKPPPKSADTPPVANPPVRPPTTGAAVMPGTSAAATRATGQGQGLSISGGAGGAKATLDDNFCCPEYVSEQLRRIQDIWNRSRNQPDTGETTIVFEIRRDGTFTKPQVEKPSGSALLDIASQAAFIGLQLQPLPDRYTGATLKIHLTFPYVR
jgi:outer membrane biosynthesis protein TonB